MRSMPSVLAAAVICLLAAGCATTPSLGIVSKVTGPVFGFAVEDARTANALIDLKVRQGAVAEARAAVLRACPDAVLALDALRGRALGPEPAGKKGLIYAAILLKVGEGSKDEAKHLVNQVMASCGELLPVEKLLGL